MGKTVVLFDLVDVLVKNRFDRGLRSIAAIGKAGQPRPAEEDRVFRSDRARAYISGQLTAEQYLRGLAQSYGWSEARWETLVAGWNDGLDSFPEGAALAAAVMDAGHPAYLFGDADPLHYERAKELLGPLARRFAGHVLSFEEGTSARDPQFFLRALARLRLRPADCAFLTTDPLSAEAARDATVPSIYLREFDEARAFLRRWDVRLG